MTALARRTDPATSHAAARFIERSGALVSQRNTTLEALRKFPGRTAKELSEEALLDYHMLARRLPELEEAGLVVRGPARGSWASARVAHTWRLAP